MKSIHRPEYRKLIEALVEARKKKGVTQQELAQKLGKPQSYVSKFENGERRLDVVEFVEVAKEINLNYKGLISKI